LRCHYCNYKTALINICPVCNSGYVKLGGTGTEKIESEAARIFPQARISVINDKGDFDSSADIVIATSSVLKHSELTFSLIAVLGIDNSFNRIDFRATERAYSILAGLANLTKDKIIIQSALRNNHALLACTNNDAQYFYKNEMRERKRFNFPPYRHFALVKLRGYSEEKVSLAAEALFKKLNIAPKKEAIKVLSLSAAVQPKLRGNYYWQILLSSKKSLQLGTFLKLNLKDFRHSGIIVTVDIDPS
jgi:primosomal protein N' (replication factor Y)